MKGDFQEKIYCADDDEYRMFCDICDKLCIDGYYSNQLKSGIHITNIRKKQRLIKTK